METTSRADPLMDAPEAGVPGVSRKALEKGNVL